MSEVVLDGRGLTMKPTRVAAVVGILLLAVTTRAGAAAWVLWSRSSLDAGALGWSLSEWDPDETFETKAECERKAEALYAALLHNARHVTPLRDGRLIVMNFEIDGKPVVRAQYYKCWPVGLDPRRQR